MLNNALTITIGNISESYEHYLIPARKSVDDFNQYGYRAAMWKGSRKLVITSYPIQNLSYLQDILSLNIVANLSPIQPSRWLCRDILRERKLFQEIIDMCNHTDVVEIIPYSSTHDFLQLIEALELELRQRGCTVVFPETSRDQNLRWMWGYFNSKIGFRHLIGEWLRDEVTVILPEGYIAQNVHQAASIVNWFLSRGKKCICKSSAGVLGLGSVRFLTPNHNITREGIVLMINQEIKGELFPVVVEEFITSSAYPSSEVYVSANPDKVQVTYNCVQTFSSSSRFNGVLVGRAILPSDIEQTMSQYALRVGEKLQHFGYIGIFDLDFAIDASSGRLYVLEANLRRTGGTHVHELATHILGQDYAEKYCLLSMNKFDLSSATSLKKLLSRLESCLFPIQSQNQGVIVTDISGLPHQCGLMVVAASSSMIGSIVNRVRELLG